MLQKLLALAVAGGLGTIARFGLSQLVHRVGGTSFPWGTVVVNFIGCLLVGIIWGIIDQKDFFNQATRTLVLIGFMGAFTTFSAYILETSHLFQSGHWLSGMGNLFLQNVGGFAAFGVGLALIKVL